MFTQTAPSEVQYSQIVDRRRKWKRPKCAMYSKTWAVNRQKKVTQSTGRTDTQLVSKMNVSAMYNDVNIITNWFLHKINKPNPIKECLSHLMASLLPCRWSPQAPQDSLLGKPHKRNDSDDQTLLFQGTILKHWEQRWIRVSGRLLQINYPTDPLWAKKNTCSLATCLSLRNHWIGICNK